MMICVMTSKICYECIGDAVKAAGKFDLRKRDKRRNKAHYRGLNTPFRCSWCETWHIGHRPKQTGAYTRKKRAKRGKK